MQMGQQSLLSSGMLTFVRGACAAQGLWGLRRMQPPCPHQAGEGGLEALPASARVPEGEACSQGRWAAESRPCPRRLSRYSIYSSGEFCHSELPQRNVHVHKVSGIFYRSQIFTVRRVVHGSFKIKFPSRRISVAVFFLPLQRREPLCYRETPTDGDKRSLSAHHLMKGGPRSSSSSVKFSLAK